MSRPGFFTHLWLLAAGAELVESDFTPADLREAAPEDIEAALLELEAIRDALDAIEERLTGGVALEEEAASCAQR